MIRLQGLVFMSGSQHWLCVSFSHSYLQRNALLLLYRIHAARWLCTCPASSVFVFIEKRWGELQCGNVP